MDVVGAKKILVNIIHSDYNCIATPMQFVTNNARKGRAILTGTFETYFIGTTVNKPKEKCFIFGCYYLLAETLRNAEK